MTLPLTLFKALKMPREGGALDSKVPMYQLWDLSFPLEDALLKGLLELSLIGNI
jgi:hypothetical protein